MSIKWNLSLMQNNFKLQKSQTKSMIDDKPLVRAACFSWCLQHSALPENRKHQSCRELLFLEFRIQESEEDVRVSQCQRKRIAFLKQFHKILHVLLSYCKWLQEVFLCTQYALTFAYIIEIVLQRAVNVLPLWPREHKSRGFYRYFNKPVNTQ